VRLVIDAVVEGGVGPALDGSRLGLLGHSRGGGVVLLAAANDPRVRAVVTWAAIATFDRYTERAKAEWRARGRLDVPNTRTGQILWLDREVLEDVESRAAQYDLQAAARRLGAKLRIVHGDQDEAVDPADAHLLHEWSGAGRGALVIIPRTGHTFGAVHPWAGPTPAWEQAVDATADWFERSLAVTSPDRAGGPASTS
jgi:dipeptidyl aminopeptidase/acylaminoacyl peptidase